MKGAFEHGVRILLTGVLVTLSGPICAASAPPTPKTADLRILVDVSGSMKHTDPLNLRRPALRLLAELLPPDARAGIWTFAQSVKLLVPPGDTNQAWKKKAEHAASEVNSRGLFTDIEQVLDKATAGWKPSPSRRRDIILLTDGMVDVSKHAEVSAASRKRILDAVLPRLRREGIRVNTIALSNQADHQLMRQLALGTGGRFDEVDDSAQLERVFLHLFERTTSPDTVPIKNNRFLTDASVKEATVLVFHASGARPTELVTPDGKKFGQASAPTNVRWHHEDSYDLITISQPMPGRWSLVADVDPDNRVMVATDLQLHMDPLPDNVLAGEKLDVVADLTNKGKPISRKDFLKLLHVNLLTRTGGNGTASTLAMQRTDNGQFRAALKGMLRSGRYELAVRVNGGTFQREQRQDIQVFDSPVAAHVAVLKEGRTKTYRITFQPRHELVSGDAAKLSVTLTSPTGKTSAPRLQTLPGGAWQTTVATLGPGTYKLAYRVAGQTLRGRAFTVTPKALQLEGPKAAPAPKAAANKSAPADANAKAASRVPAHTDWPLTLALVGGTNALVLLPGAIGFVFWRRRRSRQPEPADEI